MEIIGGSEDGTWSTWAANHICSKKDPDEVWRDAVYRKKLWGKLLISESTSRKLRENGEKVVYYPPTQEEFFGNT